MSEAQKQVRQQRIIVGMRSTSEVDRAMAAAAVLASVVEAEIVGLFVQEPSMLQLAEFPFARVLDFNSPSPRKVSPTLMQDAIARTAAVCKRALSAHASKARVNWSFSSEKGEFSARLKTLAGSGDFVVLPGQTHGFGTRNLIEDVRALPESVAGVVVAALHRSAQGAGPVVAIDDGDEAGSQTVVLAARMAAISGQPLHLFVISGSQAEAARIEARAAAMTGPGQTVLMHRYTQGSPQSLAAGLSHLSPSFVVGDLNGEPFGDDSSAIALFRAARAPVLLLRIDQLEQIRQ